MPVCIIDGLEEIDIDNQQGNVRGIHTLHQHVVSAAVEEAGQSIMGGFMAEPFSGEPVFFQNGVVGSGDEAKLFNSGRRNGLLCTHQIHHLGQRLADQRADEEDNREHDQEKEHRDGRLDIDQNCHFGRCVLQFLAGGADERLGAKVDVLTDAVLEMHIPIIKENGLRSVLQLIGRKRTNLRVKLDRRDLLRNIRRVVISGLYDHAHGEILGFDQLIRELQRGAQVHKCGIIAASQKRFEVFHSQISAAGDVDFFKEVLQVFEFAGDDETADTIGQIIGAELHVRGCNLGRNIPVAGSLHPLVALCDGEV